MASAKGAGGSAKGAQADVDVDIDALYRLPINEFTAARNALAARLKKAGQAEDSERVRTLPKPSMTAWAVNQLYWTKRDAYDRLIAAGERFRTAQASQLAGKKVDIREPLEARRAALAETSKLAAAVLRQIGSNPNPDTMRRITTTLEALSTYGALPNAPRPGRLTDDVEPPGFEALSALVPRIGGGARGSGPTRIIPFEQKKKARGPKRKTTPEEEAKRHAEERKAQQAAARAALQEAERALRDARKTAQKAEEALKKAAARAKQADQEKAEAEQRFEKAAADADAARQHARKIAAEAEEAAQAVADAERALEKATRELKDLT
jgi:DNA repair exonuclease SbcCD ATPase subunit